MTAAQRRRVDGVPARPHTGPGRTGAVDDAGGEPGDRRRQRARRRAVAAAFDER